MLTHRNELSVQVVSTRLIWFLFDRVLQEEGYLLRLYFGIGHWRYSFEKLIALFDGECRVNVLLESTLKRLRYFDEILTIDKYLYR